MHQNQKNLKKVKLLFKIILYFLTRVKVLHYVSNITVAFGDQLYDFKDRMGKSFVRSENIFEIHQAYNYIT